jgi:hypothetical protein
VFFPAAQSSILNPPHLYSKTTTKMFETWWHYRQAQIAQRGKALEVEIRKLDSKIEHLMDRLVETDSDSMVKAYETGSRNPKLTRPIWSKNPANRCPMRSFDAALRTSLDFIA